jgi:hypothetical protein
MMDGGCGCGMQSEHCEPILIITTTTTTTTTTATLFDVWPAAHVTYQHLLLPHSLYRHSQKRKIALTKLRFDRVLT